MLHKRCLYLELDPNFTPLMIKHRVIKKPSGGHKEGPLRSYNYFYVELIPRMVDGHNYS